MLLRLRTHISLFLLLVLSILLVPKEFIHGFYGHTDTPHDYCKHHHGTHVEPKHIHCEFLDFNVPSFFTSFASFSFSNPIETALPETQTYVKYTSSCFNISLLRGPPFLNSWLF